MKYIDWENYWYGLLWLSGVVLVSLGLIALSMNHQVRRYYVNSQDAESLAGISCVYTDEPWNADSRVYCSAEPTKVFEYARQANELLAKFRR